MTLVKFKKSRLPWYDTMFTDLLGSDRLLTNDLFMENKWIPAMNVKEKDELFEIEIAAPGFTKNDFEISIENGLLKISAENSEELKKEGIARDVVNRVQNLRKDMGLDVMDKITINIH